MGGYSGGHMGGGMSSGGGHGRGPPLTRSTCCVNDPCSNQDNPGADRSGVCFFRKSRFEAVWRIDGNNDIRLGPHHDSPPETAAMTDYTADAAIDSPISKPEGRPPVSPARVAANLANAAKSTGPRTAEGKARSRANAVKHGLAGEGICLPNEDAAIVRERCLQLHEEMAPTTLRGMMMVEAMAIAHTRMKRAVRQEVAVLSYKMRHAGQLTMMLACLRPRTTSMPFT